MGRILLKKLIVVQLVGKLLTFDESRRFIAMFARPRLHQNISG
jgi:hypothetical protein